jgi:hypothetical protein
MEVTSYTAKLVRIDLLQLDPQPGMEASRVPMIAIQTHVASSCREPSLTPARIVKSGFSL